MTQLEEIGDNIHVNIYPVKTEPLEMTPTGIPIMINEIYNILVSFKLHNSYIVTIDSYFDTFNKKEIIYNIVDSLKDKDNILIFSKTYFDSRVLSLLESHDSINNTNSEKPSVSYYEVIKDRDSKLFEDLGFVSLNDEHGYLALSYVYLNELGEEVIEELYSLGLYDE